MALVNIDSEVIYVGHKSTRLTETKVPPSSGKVLQAVCLLEEGGPVRFNASTIPTSSGVEGSMRLERKGKLTIVGSEDLLNIRFIQSGSQLGRIVVNYQGEGGS